MNRCLYFTLIYLLFFCSKIFAEPWISTDKGWLRADIDTLANIGVIQSPVTTWPLVWGPILKDLNRVAFSQIPAPYQATYLRVLREGKQETGKDSSLNAVRLSFSSEPQLFRYFGDKARDKRELATRATGMSSHFAWNLEVTLAPDSVDGDDKRFDGSYIAGVLDNWIISAGQVERWWGPGWQHSIILSNNAKPVPSIGIQRNYSEPFESQFLSWIGPWTFNAFIGLLDDERTVDNARLLGMSIGFKPIDSLEIGLRRTAQWGGEGRPENFDSFVDLLIGLDNCDEGGLSCEGERNEPGNQLAGIDITWKPFAYVPLSIYLQTIGEDEAGYAPSKKSFLYGFKSAISLASNPMFINVEFVDTSVDGDGNLPGEPFDGYNVLYEHGIYRNGYRYNGRTIGSTIDNDSTSFGISLVYQSNELGKFDVKASAIQLNKDSANAFPPGGHSITDSEQKISEISFKWLYETRQSGQFNFKVVSRDKSVESNFGIFETLSMGFDWIISF